MTKIEALEQTIYNVENNILSYRWYDCGQCNCGVVASTILNRESGAFSCHGVCITTGEDMPKVFQALKDAGFTHKDLIELEFLGNKEILDNIGKKGFFCSEGYWIMDGVNDYTNKENLIIYLKEWVRLLKLEIPQKVVTQPTPEKIRYVGVPISLTEQSKQLITN
jgi:hypothetical protein